MISGLILFCRRMLRTIPVLALFVLFNCDFEPEGEFFSEVDPGDGANLAIDLNSMSDTDTAFVFSTTSFSFSNQASPGVGRKTSIIIDNKVTQVITAASGTFTINPDLYSDGVHSLAIEFTGSSASGSLADLHGMEDAVVKKQWVLVVDKSNPTSVPIISVEIVDGMLEITWERYQKGNFQEYVLEKYIIFDGVASLCDEDVIPDRDQVVLRDSSNMRGNIRYALKVRAGTRESASTYKSFNAEYNAQLTSEQVGVSQVKLTWRKPPLYASFKQYAVTASGYAVNEYREIFDIDDTTAVFTLSKHYGIRNAVSFSLLPLGENQCASYIADTLSISNGNIFASFYGNSIVYNEPLDAYYAIAKDAQWLNSLVRINSGGRIEKSYFIKSNGVFAISENGQYLYVAYNNVLKQLDPVSFDVIRTYNLAELSNFAQPSGEMRVANNGMISITVSGRTYVLDNSFQALKQTTDGSGKISVNGDFYAERNRVYKRSGSGFIQVFTGTFSPLEFIHDDKLLFAAGSFDEVGVFDLQTNSIERQFPFEGTMYSFKYDPQSNMIGAFKQSYQSDGPATFFLYSTSLQLLKSFEIESPDIHVSRYTILTNNNLICSDGYSLPLSLFHP